MISSELIGQEAEASTEVTPELTVRHFHAEMPAVYGTPFMIYLMELASSNAVQPHLPAGWASVGVEVNVRHLAPTPVGRMVTARARVVGVNEQRIEFEVQAHDGVRLIGTGMHVRSPIDLARFEKRLAEDSA